MQMKFVNCIVYAFCLDGLILKVLGKITYTKAEDSKVII